MADGKLAIATILGVLSGIFVTVSGVLYRLELLIGPEGIIAFWIPSRWHPPFLAFLAPGLGIFFGSAILALIILSQTMAGQAGRLGVAIIGLSVIISVVGDEFWLGGAMGIIGGALLILSGGNRSGQPRGTPAE